MVESLDEVETEADGDEVKQTQESTEEILENGCGETNCVVQTLKVEENDETHIIQSEFKETEIQVNQVEEASIEEAKVEVKHEELVSIEMEETRSEVTQEASVKMSEVTIVVTSASEAELVSSSIVDTCVTNVACQEETIVIKEESAEMSQKVEESHDMKEEQSSEIDVACEETKEEEASITPDLIKACNEADSSTNEEINDEQPRIENEDITTQDEEREDKLTQLAQTVHQSQTLCKLNKKAQPKTDPDASSKSNVILDLSPAPLVVDNKTASVEKEKKIQSKLSSSKQGMVTKRNTLSKKSTEKVRIAGKTVDFNSDKAQYLHLTMDQIQELAFKQRGGDTAADAHIDNNSNDGHKDDHQHFDAHCPLHNSKQSLSDGSKKFATLPRQRRPKKDSPDLVKEAEASNRNVTDSQKTAAKSSNGKIISRSKSFSSRSSNETKSKMTGEAASPIAKKGDYKASKGGGLFAPTQSWLLKCMNDKKAMMTKEHSSTGPNIARRSLSSSRNHKDRSVSPVRRIREPFAPKTSPVVKPNTVKKVTIDKNIPKANKNVQQKSVVDVKKQAACKTKTTIKAKESNKLVTDVTKTEDAATKDEVNGTVTDKEETNDTSKDITGETVENTIDSSSESATQVIQKFENKISRTKSNSVKRSQSLKIEKSSTRKENESLKMEKSSTRKDSATEIVKSKKEKVQTSKTLSNGIKSRAKTSKLETKVVKEENLSESNSMTRTTMIVKLHPGDEKRLSAYLEGQQNGDSNVQLRDNPGASKDDIRRSICGLEISFTSLPQDIDIKLIPTCDNCEEN